MEAGRGTIAGIVVFHPDEGDLLRLVRSVAEDVDEVVIYANSAVAPAFEAALREGALPAPLAILSPDGNLGLGRAYDALLARAEARGAAHLFVLDQDSLPRPGTIPALAARFRAIESAGGRPAIVGPRPVDPTGQPMRIARRRPEAGARPIPGATRVEFVISSGSLVGVAAARTVGPFRADFFIDAIDLEWCFRANARGFSIWVAEDVRMDHRLGRGVIRVPGGLLLADQPPRRLYTFIRNQLSMLRLPHVPARHKAKTLLSLPARILVYLARNRFSRDTRAAIRNGLVDGARDRLGPPDGAFRPWRDGRSGRAKPTGTTP